MTGCRSATGDWSLEHRFATATELHQPWPDPGSTQQRRIAICRVLGPAAVVLGSTQGRAVTGDGSIYRPPPVRRRGGGGAVFVAPARQVWIEIWVPRGDPLWDDDIVASSAWVGDAWAAALAGFGVSGVSVHRGPSTGDSVAGAVCFAGLGPGEVSAGDPARKVMGLTQHRTRFGARMQTMAVMRWDPEPIVAELQRLGLVDGTEAEAVVQSASTRATGLEELGMVVSPRHLHRVERAVVERLAAC